MSSNRRPLNVWVRDEGQHYVPGQRVTWVPTGNPPLILDPRGADEIVRAELDEGMTPERWFRVQILAT